MTNIKICTILCLFLGTNLYLYFYIMNIEIAKEPIRYVYTTMWIYELLCSEDYFYTFLNYNSKKWFSVSEWLEILEISWEIKFIW